MTTFFNLGTRSYQAVWCSESSWLWHHFQSLPMYIGWRGSHPIILLAHSERKPTWLLSHIDIHSCFGPPPWHQCWASPVQVKVTPEKQLPYIWSHSSLVFFTTLQHCVHNLWWIYIWICFDEKDILLGQEIQSLFFIFLTPMIFVLNQPKHSYASSLCLAFHLNTLE